MRPELTRGSDRLGSAAYLLAALLVVVPIGDYIASIWVLRTGDPLQWRYGSEGLLASFLITPCLGLALAIAVATWRGNVRLLMLIGSVMVLVGVLLVPVCGDFALNALQLRRSAPPDAVARLEMGTAKTILEYVFVAIVLVFGGFSARRAGRTLSSEPRETRPPHVVVPRPGSR